MNRIALVRRLARLLATGVLVGTPLAAFAGPDAETSEWRRTVTVMTHDSFAASEEVLAAFESRHGVRVRILEAGDTGTALNKAILARGKPLADVIYGIDNTFLSRALDEDILEPYRSRMLASVPEEFQIDPSYRALPVDYGDVCLNYHVASFGGDGPPPPADLDDASGRTSSTGNFRSSRIESISVPTAPVAPTTATVYADFFFISCESVIPAVSSGNPRFSLLSPSPQPSPTSGEGVDYGFSFTTTRIR